MSYNDKQITCSDCGVAFTFSAGEQESFAARGYTNEPKRCPICRAAKKQSTSGGSSYGSGGSGNRNYSSAPRQMFPVKCATCGKDTEVPFEPRSGRPVYCSDCYRKTNPVKRYQLSGDDDWGEPSHLTVFSYTFAFLREFTIRQQWALVNFLYHIGYVTE